MDIEFSLVFRHSSEGLENRQARRRGRTNRQEWSGLQGSSTHPVAGVSPERVYLATRFQTPRFPQSGPARGVRGASGVETKMLPTVAGIRSPMLGVLAMD